MGWRGVQLRDGMQAVIRAKGRLIMGEASLRETSPMPEGYFVERRKALNRNPEGNPRFSALRFDLVRGAGKNKFTICKYHLVKSG